MLADDEGSFVGNCFYEVIYVLILLLSFLLALVAFAKEVLWSGREAVLDEILFLLGNAVKGYVAKKLAQAVRTLN